MKAVFFQAAVYTAGFIDYNFSIYQDDGTYVDNCNVDLTINGGVTTTTPGATIMSDVMALVIAFGVPRSWTLTTGDFIWNGFFPYSIAEWNAIQSALPAAKVFGSATFSNATTATKLSASRDAQVQYAFDASVAISLLAGQSVTAVLKYADDSGMTTNVVTVDSQTTSNSGVLGLTQTNTLKVSGIVPKNKFRQVTFSVTGTGATAPTAIKASQEVLL